MAAEALAAMAGGQATAGAGAILQSLLGAGQMIQGGIMRKKAQKKFDANQYEIPASVQAMLDVVKNVASQRNMPGYDQYLQRIGSTTAQGVEAAQRSGQSSSDVLGALQGLYGRQMSQQQDMSIANAQNYQRNQMQLANALNTMGGYETQKWNYNVLYPYMQQMTAAGQVSGAGAGNLAGGIESAMSVGMANEQMKNDQRLMDEYMKTKFPTVNANPAQQQLRNLGSFQASTLAPPVRNQSGTFGYPTMYNLPSLNNDPYGHYSGEPNPVNKY